MRTLLLSTLLILGWNLNAQISINPDKIKERTKKELNKQVEPKKDKKSKSNSLNQSTQTNRKRPGGTINATPASSGRKEETTPPTKKEGGK